MAPLRIVPIGFESLGVRSMCTYIETDDVRILVDAGVALGPRLRRLPHPREYRARDACRAKIREYAARADIVTVSHYHNDHHTPNYTETVWLGSSAEECEQIYKDKIVLLKDIRNAINFSQRRRGWMFQRFIKKIASKCEIADGKVYEYGATKLRISPPVPHGEEQGELGWVLMTTVEADGEGVVHASDVQGPMSKQTARLIMKEKPGTVVLGGPPLYLENIKVEKASIQRGIENAARIAGKVQILIFEHHLLRSDNWRERVSLVYDAAMKGGHKVLTAADYLGTQPQLLESNREHLYEQDPPSEAFLKWSKLPRERQRVQSAPI
jgi:predicted metallo-beta-lactamase superfamily hydrolase